MPTAPTSVFSGLARATPGTVGVIGVKANPTADITSESGIGAIASYAGALWFTTYPDENANGAGMGLWRMGDDYAPVLVSETNGTHAGRALFGTYLYMGEHKIARDGTITRLTGFATDDRITSWAKLPGDASYVYALTMGGKIYKTAPTLSAVTYVANATTGLSIAGQPHFKAAWGCKNRLYIVANINTPDGRFGYYDYSANTFTRLETAGDSFIEVAGSYDGNSHAFAFGQDDYTGFMYLIDGLNDTPAAPRRFLLPLMSKQLLKGWQQEWMRLRMVETERFLLNFHGGYYEVSPVLDGNDSPTVGFPRIEPIGRHGRTVSDFTIHNGYLVMGGNQSSPQTSNKYPNTGQPQSTLAFLRSVDDLFTLQRPRGFGYLIRNFTSATAWESDPMLMKGFDKKCLHIKNDGGSAQNVQIYVYQGTRKNAYQLVSGVAAGGGYQTVAFPDAFEADWITIAAGSATTLSAWMTYK